MAKEFRFIDPAFSCEIILRKTSKALYEACEGQFNRLKYIRNLGLIGHFDDTGFHTKYHHLIGLLRLFEKLLMQPKGVGLPKKFLWSFWPRICFAQTGHAAFAYDSEKAVLLAAKLDPSFKQKLKEFLNPVINKASSYKDIAGNSEEARKAILEGWFDSLIEEYRWNQLYFWVAALKLTQNATLISILDQERKNRNREVENLKKTNKKLKPDKDVDVPSFDAGIAFEILLNPNSKWDFCCRRFNRLDYVVRDLSFTGRIAVYLDVDRLLAHVQDKQDPDWHLVDSLDDYLTDTLYASEKHQLEAAIFQRTLADLLIKGTVSLDELFGGQDDKYINDDALTDLLKRTAQGQSLFDMLNRSHWSVWRLPAKVSKQDHPLDLEMKLAGRRQGNAILKDPQNKNLVGCRDVLSSGVVLGMCHKGSEQCPTPADFLLLCKRAISTLYPRVSVQKYHMIVSEGISGKKVVCNLNNIVQSLASVTPPELSSISKASEFICRRTDNESPKEDEPKFVIGDVIQSVKTADFSLSLKVMKAVFEDPKGAGKLFNTDIKGALEIFWAHLISWQHRYFVTIPPKSIVPVLGEVQQELLKRVVAGGTTKDADLEAYAFLESLINPGENVLFRLSLPNWIILNDDNKEHENEYDVITFLMRSNKDVEVWIWGCTTNQDLEVKRSEDTTKINKLKDILGRRWSGEIRTVQNYVHKENDCICLEIDGRQVRRQNNA